MSITQGIKTKYDCFYQRIQIAKKKNAQNRAKNRNSEMNYNFKQFSVNYEITVLY